MVACAPADSAPVTDAFSDVHYFFIFLSDVHYFFIFRVCENINALFWVFFVFLFIHEIADHVWILGKKRLNFLLGLLELRVEWKFHGRCLTMHSAERIFSDFPLFLKEGDTISSFSIHLAV